MRGIHARPQRRAQAAIGELALLEDLNLAGNQLTTLPPEIGAWPG